MPHAVAVLGSMVVHAPAARAATRGAESGPNLIVRLAPLLAVAAIGVPAARRRRRRGAVRRADRAGG